jgi:parvulin-like peptidyl-prolyl isomerase
MKDKLQLFQNQKIRSVWDENEEKWYFAIIDVVGVLTESPNPRKYWSVLKTRLKKEGSQLTTNCSQLKMRAADGKKYLTDAVDTEQLLRLIQSIPSKKAEPFKMWLAKVGRERIDEVQDPELTVNRLIHEYRALGYDEDWINLRLQSIQIRKGLTDEWDKSGVEEGLEYAILTDLMYKTWADMNTKEYKQHKGLKKENLRDNMTDAELVLNMLAEVSARDISIEEQPASKDESARIAKRGANVAKTARAQLEGETGKKVISSKNADDLKRKNQIS